MKDFLRKIYYAIITHLPAYIVINFETFRTYKKFLSKNNPKYFGEKIQWLKLYGNLEKYSKYVDKCEVRNYVKDKIGEEYLIPIIGVYNSYDEIDFDKLPDSFILKNNNGSAMNYIVKDKSKINYSYVKKIVNKWLKSKYYRIKKENQYKNVNNKIICEKYIADTNSELLDYKFFCFNGNPKFIKIDHDRYTKHTSNFYDVDWNKLVLMEQGYPNYKGDDKKPKNFKKMIELAKKLSEEFQFVRVDMYNISGKIFFGELTFTPASGKNAFFPIEKDIEIAKEIIINNEKN